mgnify:CR=1 FL=1
MLKSLIVTILTASLGMAAVSCGAPRPGGKAVAGCQPHVEIHGSGFWAKELGRTEAWVLQNHRINLWQRPGSDRGSKVGELLVGSRALVLENSPGAYRVKSPADGSTGWISDIQVAKTLNQDVSTREPCEAAQKSPPG